MKPDQKDLGIEEYLRSRCLHAAHEYYGARLPEAVEQRLRLELGKVSYGNSWRILKLLTDLTGSLDDGGYFFFSRGNMCSSLILYLLQITKVNPLPPHYCCGSCHRYEEPTCGQSASGEDLPDRYCPECGSILRKEGIGVQEVFFYGLQGEKEMDLSLGTSSRGLQWILKEIEDGRFGGKISIIRNDGYYKIGIPEGKVSISSNYLADAAEEGRKIEDLSFPEEAVEIINAVHPADYEELTRAMGLYHGTDLWKNNADGLLRQGYSVKQLPIFREDVYDCLCCHGFDRAEALAVTHNGLLVSKRVDENLKRRMCENGIPEWYSGFLERAYILFSKAHVAERLNFLIKLADNDLNRVINHLVKQEAGCPEE